MKPEQIKKILRMKKQDRILTSDDFVSTGSTLLNCAITGYPDRGFAKGKYYFIVGDSASGKTFLTLTCLAEASNNPNFDNYRFIYDNAEDGALMDVEKFFGKKVSKRLSFPAEGDIADESFFSSSIEEFYYNVDDAIQKEQPFIYILDSMDALSSDQEREKFDETKEAYRKGKTTSGSYGDGKAKKNAANLRRLLTPLRKTGSILIILNQTRDNLGFGFEKKVRSGGHALRFYATVELWSSVKSKIKRTVRGKPRQLGIECKVQIKKNRITGRERNVIIPIFHSFGIDDTGSCIDYLLDEKHWQTKGDKIKADEFDLVCSRSKLIKEIEEGNLEADLQDIVGEVWKEIEDASSVKRKKRYE
jgi:RecA/RadA recombinase